MSGNYKMKNGLKKELFQPIEKLFLLNLEY